jgi:hypothetical protein
VTPRILTDVDDPVYTDVADEDIRKRQVLDPDPGRHGPPMAHCPVCGKPLEAQLLCSACGDPEEMAA